MECNSCHERQGTGLWDMSGGSDPWYMKRVVDYVIAERATLYSITTGLTQPVESIRDHRYSPGHWRSGGLLYLGYLRCPQNRQYGGLCLPQQYTGHSLLSQWLESPPRAHSRNAGIISAWLIALMPGHLSRSTFAYADHDSFAMLFLAIALYFWIRGLEQIQYKKVFKSTSANPLYIIAGIRETWKSNPVLMSNATMAGIAFSIMALGWKGFVYGPKFFS